MKTTYSLPHPSASFSISDKIAIPEKSLEKWRLLIMSASLLLQGCVLAPALVLVSSFYDKGLTDLSLIVALIGMVAILVSNLAIANIKLILGTIITNTILTIVLVTLHFLL